MLKPGGLLIYEGFCFYSLRNIDRNLGVNNNPLHAIQLVFACAMKIKFQLNCFHKHTSLDYLLHCTLQQQLEGITAFYTEHLGKARLEINKCGMTYYPSEKDKNYLDHGYHFTLSATKS